MRRSIVGERMQVYAYFGQMVAITKLLSSEERADLARWDSVMVSGDGRYATSDWPGWKKYIGKLPKYPPIPERKETISQEVRWQVWESNNFTCQHCGTRSYLSVDHIIPESKGGRTTLNNLQTLCQRCNSRKGTKEPEFETASSKEG